MSPMSSLYVNSLKRWRWEPRSERGRWESHVRGGISAGGQSKPQKPFSSCLKECNTVTLCICSRGVCGWAGVCDGGQRGGECVTWLLCFRTLVLLGGSFAVGFVSSVETRDERWRFGVLGAAVCMRVCVCVLFSVWPSPSVPSAL